MKAIFITYNQSLTGLVQTVLDKHSVRGYSQWIDVRGRGSVKGIPREGTHTWPELNNAHIVMVEDEKVAPILANLKEINKEYEQHGLRAFVWNIEDSI
ncbi:MAG: PG0541 family transporter-associated protein [Salinivirgaceae bacterium]|jgi:nitrogen regulatory protein PII|nr:hypothetical protein [Bacteroidales bacterium]HPW66911.1 hypothetical protein [Salinivirgaceae bacterium]